LKLGFVLTSHSVSYGKRNGWVPGVAFGWDGVQHAVRSVSRFRGILLEFDLTQMLRFERRDNASGR
jgi:hypothetical protein